MTPDPVDALAAVVDLAQQRRRLANLLGMVRRIDETDEQTVKRLIEERDAVVQLLLESGAPELSPDAEPAFAH